MAKVTIDTQRCKGCELCVEACPQGVIAMSKSLNDKGVHFAQPARLEDCTGCGLCAVMCPEVIVEVEREEVPNPPPTPGLRGVGKSSAEGGSASGGQIPTDNN